MNRANKIENIAVEDLIPYARNARLHSDEQVAQIAGSIKEFGFNNPVLIDGEGGIIAGHGRVLAARKLKMSQVPCVRLSHLTETQKKAYILADNKIAQNSSWDDELLKLEIEDLKTSGFDTDILGWVQLPEFGATPDYSILDGSNVGSSLDDMADGVKKAIQIEFEPHDYLEAQELIKFWRQKGAYVGSMLIGFLRTEKNKL